MKFNNTYYIIRHGLSTSNVQSYLSAWPEKKISRLTPEGKQTIKKAAQSFKKIGIDLIFTSDLHRTQQTAQIISKITGAKIIIDKGLRELNPGIFNHTYNGDYTGYFKGKQVEESETDESYGEKPEDSAMVLHEPDQPDVVVDKPYVIAPEEFGEMDGYNTISLTYYADNVLADDIDELVEDVDETVGLDSLNHFGEYEDDSVFVRNDRLRSDYEILRDNRTYEDWVVSRRHPHSAEE